ncbi:MAG: SpoIID/LytB domain-containing protein [Chloroflexi bacterium]|nr:SpoIID/LytB domain-containing protein [Chloroflexota bacterium]
MRHTVTRSLTLVLVVAAVLIAPPAAAVTDPALPATVRVNVAGLGTVSAEIGSTGSFTATDAAGNVLYRGSAPLVARRDVYRLRSGLALPDRRTPPRDAEERAKRVALMREARVEQAELGPYAIVIVPFELAAPSTDDPIGEVVMRAQDVPVVHFAPSDGLLEYAGRAYRGTLDLQKDDEGDMIVVNTVTTAAYLASVVGSEIPPSWEPEALAAQAIAARTYLATHLHRHAGYDLEGDTRDQQYDGRGGETSATVRAVERTAGVIATYRGAPIEALYSANAGGATEDSENVFPNALPYLRSVPSPWDDVAADSSWGAASWRWTKEWTGPELSRYLRQRGIDVGEVDRIDLVKVSKTGRVLEARIVGSTGTRTVGKDTSRYYFGLRSTLFTVSKHPGGETEIVRDTDTKRIGELAVLGARRVSTTYRIDWDAAHEIHHLTVAGYVYAPPARFVFAGRGDGHGVGMSQWGMEGMALAGYSAEQILTHYYTGIALSGTSGP